MIPTATPCTPARLPLAIAAAVAIVPAISNARDSQPGESKVEQAIDQRKSQVRTKLTREGITRGWFGAAPAMEEHGIRFEAAITSFSQAGFGASGGSETFSGGKIDGLLFADLHKLGLWQGLRLTAHPEYNLGQSPNGYGGTVLPTNVAMQLPGTTGSSRFDVSSVFLTQRIGEQTTLILGKTNLADVAALHPYAGGAGLTGFMNAGLAANPNGAIPAYVYGGLLAVKTRLALLTFGVYGGDSAQGSFNFADAFDQGYLLATGLAVPVSPCGLPGRQSISLLWGDRDAGDLSKLGDILPPGGITSLQNIDTRRWVLGYSFHQQLGKWNGGDRSWGVWGRAGIGDNRLTAIAWSAAGGIGGDSPFENRANDRWGVGLFHYSFADFLDDPGVSPVLLEDEYGIEIFYKAGITPWLLVTADLQIIQPAVPRQDTVAVLGLRASLRF